MKTKTVFSVCLVGMLAAFPFAACTTTPEHEYALGIESEKNGVLISTVEGYDTASITAYVTCDGKRDDSLVPTFSSGNSEVATVSETGVIKAVGGGVTEITASYTVGETTLSKKTSVEVLEATTAESVNSFNEEHVNLYGRTYFTGQKLTFDNVCTGIEVAFVGTELSCTFDAENFGSKIRVIIDNDELGESVVLASGNTKKTLCKNLTEGIHTALIAKAASPQYGSLYLPAENAFETDGTFLKAKTRPSLKIEFLGDSITAGAGAAGTSTQANQTVENSDATLTYAFLTARALDADFSIMALEGICAKDGSTNVYDSYLHYSFGNSAAYDPALFDADFVVIGLGENDMWHATSNDFPYTTQQFKKDYTDLIKLVRQTRPNATIVCVYGMMPAASTNQAKELIESAIADTNDNNVYSLKMTSNEAGACSHPNAKTHKSNGEKLTKLIKELLSR